MIRTEQWQANLFEAITTNYDKSRQLTPPNDLITPLGGAISADDFRRDCTAKFQKKLSQFKNILTGVIVLRMVVSEGGS